MKLERSRAIASFGAELLHETQVPRPQAPAGDHANATPTANPASHRRQLPLVELDQTISGEQKQIEAAKLERLPGQVLRTQGKDHGPQRRHRFGARWSVAF